MPWEETIFLFIRHTRNEQKSVTLGRDGMTGKRGRFATGKGVITLSEKLRTNALKCDNLA